MIRFKVNEQWAVTFRVGENPVAMKVADAVVVRAGALLYDGPYEVTPKADEEQILPTKGLSMKTDVIIQPIPKEYGLVTYDHNRTITVS